MPVFYYSDSPVYNRSVRFEVVEMKKPPKVAGSGGFIRSESVRTQRVYTDIVTAT
jgi:hypothetical protein